ncbi:MAG: tripartite tricarboxylate transporter substrate binding protein [Hyphomicrobiales bacterium]|nr:tripartite tricarboxylate transporter substrate binding protein [Hyphomicrobiales bacterium]
MSVSRRTAVGLMAAAIASPAFGATPAFPSRQIRIVVPYPPGGPTDALARFVAAEMQAALGQAVIVENKPGASGALGTREVAKAEADGHTIVLGNNQTHVTNAFLIKDPGYDPIKDFVPIAGLADLQHALVVRKDLGVNNVRELVELLKREPGQMNYGSTGIGSGSHLTMELFRTRTGTQMQHVPFRGAAPMALEIVAGRIDLSFATLPSVLGQVQGGEMKALAIASHVRAPQLPEVPLLKEQGVTDSEGDSWLALFAPAATPAPVVDILAKSAIAALAKPDVRDKAIGQGIAVNVRDGAAFKTYHVAEMSKWSDVIRAANVKIDG